MGNELLYRFQDSSVENREVFVAGAVY